MFFTEAELTKKPAKASGVNPASLRRLEYVAPERAICRQPLELPFGDEVVFDTETYVNYNLVAFKHLPSQQYFYMEAPFNTHALSFALSRFKLISFNGIKYDMAILRAILRGDDCLAVKALSDRIIKENERITWDDHPFNHIDVIEVCPLKGSQKLYAARLHAERIQELPIDPDTVLTGEEKLVIKDYCFNDLDNLELIYNELRPHIALREDFGRLYKTDDLRSKSDAQLAEAVIRSELHRVTGKRPQRPPSAVGKVFCYSAPAYVQFRSSELTAALASIQQTPITVGLSGHVECPAEIEGRALVIAGNAYTIGMGGLHSNEKSQSAIGNLLDIDVTGYYPNLILGNRFYPAHLGEAFLTVFQGMVDRRTESKHKFPLATDPIIRKQLETEANGLKIANNGSFGKTSDPYSIINDPQMMVQTTLTGQLSLLMLIERLTLEGFVVLSANTDGIVVDRPPSRYNNLVGIVKQWEADTCLQTEETRYSAIYSRDVNAYFALKADGVKVKGSYSDKGSALNSPLSTNPETYICSMAIQALLTNGTPIETTVRSCNDVRQFLSIKNATGGAYKDGVYLGKLIRWYYSTEATPGPILKCKSGHAVPLTEGAVPLMQLPSHLPDDLDYDWYIAKAYSILKDIGYIKETVFI